MNIIYILPSGAGKHTQKNENNSTTVRSNTDDGDTYIFRQKEREGYMRTYTRLSIGEIIELYGRVVKKKKISTLSHRVCRQISNDF